MKCPNCGSQIEDNSSFCGACGHAIQAITPVTLNEEPQLNPDIAAILCIFLGMFGFLDYYTGHKKRAYFRFFFNFTGIGIIINLIWNLINLHQIGYGLYKCANTKFLRAAPWALYPCKILFAVVVISLTTTFLLAIVVPKIFGLIGSIH